MMLEPPLQVQILVHPSAAGIQYPAGQLQGIPLLQILIDQLLPLQLMPWRHAGISIPRKIDEVKRPINPVEVDRLRATRGATGEGQPFLADQGVDQTGLPYITSTKKRDLPQPV